MIVLFKDINHDRVLVFDAEYNEGSLIQFSGLMLRKIDSKNCLFQVEKSLTVYTLLENNEVVNPFIEQFTGITQEILNKYGVTLEETQRLINNLLNVEGSLAVASHGVSNDRQILFNNGIDLYTKPNGDTIEGLCTYQMARRILKRDKNLSLGDVATDAGLYLAEQHNSYHDAMVGVGILSFLTKIDGQNKEEEEDNDLL